MTAMLERMIKLDADNYTARTHLKLLKVMQAFKRPMLVVLLSIATQVLIELDKLQYSVLGYKGGRIGLLEFLHPQRSPLIKCSQRLLDMLSCWVRDFFHQSLPPHFPPTNYRLFGWG